jgi:hypothetical protein
VRKFSRYYLTTKGNSLSNVNEQSMPSSGLGYSRRRINRMANRDDDANDSTEERVLKLKGVKLVGPVGENETDLVVCWSC